MVSEIYSKLYQTYLMRSVGKLLLKPQHWQSQLAKIKNNYSLLKIARTERYQHSFINLFGHKIELVDSASFLWTYDDIFAKQIYKFETQTQNPIIIDCGANIGLSVLYFKQLYPQSYITAFEPDREIFTVLKNNIENSGFSNVSLVNKALWNSETILEFASEKADAGRFSQNSSKLKGEKYEVSTVRLRDYLGQSVDFLKIDIEGAETQVIQDCFDLLPNVKNLFVEYHSFNKEPQNLNILINLLTEAGFRLHIHANSKSPHPFCHREINMGIDMLLNIFAFRE